MPKYDHYDPIVKAFAINNSYTYSQPTASRITSDFINDLSGLLDTSSVNTIPRQSIYNRIKRWNTSNLSSYNNKEVIELNEDFSFNYAQDNYENGNIPILDDGYNTPTYQVLNALLY